MECTFEICVFQLLDKSAPNVEEAEHVANYHHNKAVAIGVGYQDTTYIYTFSRTQQHQMHYICSCGKPFLSFYSMKNHVFECEDAQDVALRHAEILAQHVETTNLLEGSPPNPAPQPTSTSSPSPPLPPPSPSPSSSSSSSSSRRQLPLQPLQPSPRSCISCDTSSSLHCPTVPQDLRRPLHHRSPASSPTEGAPDLEPSLDSAIFKYLKRLERNQTTLEKTVKNQEQTIQQQQSEMAELRTELAHINRTKGKTHAKCQLRSRDSTPAATSTHKPPYQPSYNWREAEEIMMELKEEVMEEVIEEVVLEARGKAIEEVIAEIKKEILDEVIEEAVTETIEEFRVREIIDDLMANVKQEVMEEVIEDVIMEISKEVREEANVEVMAEVMEDVDLESKEEVKAEVEVDAETVTRVNAMEDTGARTRKAEEDEFNEEPKKKRHLSSYIGVEHVDTWGAGVAEQSHSAEYQDREMTDSDTDNSSSGTPNFADYFETSTPKNQDGAQSPASQFNTQNSNHQPDTHTDTQDTNSQTDTHTRSPNHQADTHVQSFNRRTDNHTQGAAEYPS